MTDEQKTCPYCAEQIRREAIKCRYCGSFVEPRGLGASSRPWVRPRASRMIAGVCAGLAEEFGISISVMRLAFLLGVLFSCGLAIPVYVALWIAMPSEIPADDASFR